MDRYYCNICCRHKPQHYIRTKTLGWYWEEGQRSKFGIITSDSIFPYCEECHTGVSKWRKMGAVISLVCGWMKGLYSYPDLRWRIIGKGNANYCYCVKRGLVAIVAVACGG